MAQKKLSTQAKAIGMAALGVVAGIALFNLLTTVTAGTPAAKVLDGSIASRNG